jgi:hypothetical protein
MPGIFSALPAPHGCRLFFARVSPVIGRIGRFNPHLMRVPAGVRVIPTTAIEKTASQPCRRTSCGCTQPLIAARIFEVPQLSVNFVTVLAAL